MPCAPKIIVNGIVPERAKVFRSAVYPALIEFNVERVVHKSNLILQNDTFDEERSRQSQASNETPNTERSKIDYRKGKIHPEIKFYRVLMKTGDDLRQDQLAMMMIKLMDRLLKRASLDLCVTPYSIIATSQTSGIVEFVEESVPISAILSQYQDFFVLIVTSFFLLSQFCFFFCFVPHCYPLLQQNTIQF